ncbi:MAG: TauD/TfdA family dioxygenase, partial [Actinomycetes bacterium]
MSTLTVHPLAGNIGAELHGIDLTAPLARDEIAGIRAALVEWKVVFFRDQHVSQAQHIAFGAQFGDVTPAHP